MTSAIVGMQVTRATTRPPRYRTQIQTGPRRQAPIFGVGCEDAAPAGAEIFGPFDDYWKTKAKHKAAPDPMEAVVGAAAQVKHAHDLANGDAETLAVALSPSKALHKVLEG